jgi:hypothetical protein
MLGRRSLLAVTLAVAAAFPVAVRADDFGDRKITDDIGFAIVQRDIVIKTLNFCYQRVAQDNAYIQTRDAWYLRNAADIRLLDDAIARLGGIPPEDAKTIDTATDRRVEGDMGAQPDQASFCRQFAATLNSGTSRDLSVGFRSSIYFRHIREWMQKQQP